LGLGKYIRGLAQLARALALGARGSGFESRVPDQKNMNFIEFYNQHKKRIKLVLWLFLGSMIAGGAAAFYYPELMRMISEAFAERFGEAPALDWDLAKGIFLQNVRASAIAWLGGVILGIAPFFMVVANGFVLGYVILFVAGISDRLGESILVLIAGLLPHAIFEIPAFLLAAVLGLSLGLDWLGDEARGQRVQTLKRTFLGSIKYFALVLALLVIAAVIEVFISGKLVNNL
jgi:stage II sporulation protein M